MKKYIFTLLAVSLLSACGDNREAKDRSLAKGCEAGIKSLMAQEKFDRQVDKVLSKKFSSSGEDRKVVLNVQTKQKQYGYPKDESFHCTFTETSNFLGYKAELQQIVIGEEFFGKKDGQIIGTMDEFLNLTNSVSDSMK